MSSFESGFEEHKNVFWQNILQCAVNRRYEISKQAATFQCPSDPWNTHPHFLWMGWVPFQSYRKRATPNCVFNIWFTHPDEGLSPSIIRAKLRKETCFQITSKKPILHPNAIRPEKDAAPDVHEYNMHIFPMTIWILCKELPTRRDVLDNLRHQQYNAFKIKIEFFLYRDFFRDHFQHKIVPIQLPMFRNTYIRFRKSKDYKQIAEIKLTDKVVRYYGMEIGDVLVCLEPTTTGGMAKYVCRVVIP